MTDQTLKEIIREMGEELAFLPFDQVTELIARLIEDLLPLAIIEMDDELIRIDPSKLAESEFLEKRKWGDERRIIEETFATRREVLEHVTTAKAAMKPIEVGHGTIMTLIQPQHTAENSSGLPNVRGASTEQEGQYASLPTLRTRTTRASKSRETNIRYNVDQSMTEKIKNDFLFAKFCSTIEKTVRGIAIVHKNEFIFTLKNRKDVELADWNRTILYFEVPDVVFYDANQLWSLISNETRKELGIMLKRLPESEQVRFRLYISNFNVEMVF